MSLLDLAHPYFTVPPQVSCPHTKPPKPFSEANPYEYGPESYNPLPAIVTDSLTSVLFVAHCLSPVQRKFLALLSTLSLSLIHNIPY